MSWLKAQHHRLRLTGRPPGATRSLGAQHFPLRFAVVVPTRHMGRSKAIQEIGRCSVDRGAARKLRTAQQPDKKLGGVSD